MTFHFFGTCWIRLACSSIPFESVLFHQTSAHGAFIIKGAIAGGMIAGWVSQYLGRRLTIVCVSLFVGSCSMDFNPLAVLSIFVCLIGGLVTTFNHSLHSIMDLPCIRLVVSPPALFCIQFGVQEAWVSYVFILNYYSR